MSLVAPKASAVEVGVSALGTALVAVPECLECSGMVNSEATCLPMVNILDSEAEDWCSPEWRAL